MHREFVYYHSRDHNRAHDRWSAVANTFSRWIWGILCCGMPGVPCYFCHCCGKADDEEADIPRVHQSTTTSENMSRQHRPHALRGRKSTPQMLSAVRCALTQLQGEPPPQPGHEVKQEPG